MATLAPDWEGRAADAWRHAWHAGAVHLFDSVTSTNDVAARLAATDAPSLTVVIAEEQTQGRGRGGSSWQAQPGSSLLFSVLVRMKQPAAAPGCAPLRAGLAVTRAISRCAGVHTYVKWPNDIIVEEHGKLAGILCEGALAPLGTGYLVIGVGINVLQSETAFAGDLRGRACSLLSATGERVQRGELMTAIMREITDVTDHLADPLTPDELAEFDHRDLLHGQEIVCTLHDGRVLSGVARGIDRDGALLVEQTTGLTQVYNATVRLADAHAYPGSAGE